MVLWQSSEKARAKVGFTGIMCGIQWDSPWRPIDHGGTDRGGGGWSLGVCVFGGLGTERLPPPPHAF